MRDLESDLDVTKARANAWAVGDLETLRKRAEPEDRDQCPAEIKMRQLDAPGGWLTTLRDMGYLVEEP